MPSRPQPYSTRYSAHSQHPCPCTRCQNDPDCLQTRQTIRNHLKQDRLRPLRRITPTVERESIGVPALRSTLKPLGNGLNSVSSATAHCGALLNVNNDKATVRFTPPSCSPSAHVRVAPMVSNNNKDSSNNLSSCNLKRLSLSSQVPSPVPSSSSDQLETSLGDSGSPLSRPVRPCSCSMPLVSLCDLNCVIITALYLWPSLEL